MKDKILNETAGLWINLAETGMKYEKRLRKGWKKRIENIKWRKIYHPQTKYINIQK